MDRSLTQTLSARWASHHIISKTWDIYGVIRMRRWIWEKYQTSTKRNADFCVPYSRCFSTSIYMVINRLNKSFNLSWLRVWMSYCIFINLAELLNGDLAAKIGRGIFSKDLVDRECTCSLPSKVNGKRVYEGKFRFQVYNLRGKMLLVAT